MTDLWVLRDVGPEWEIERPATVSDLLAAVVGLEGVETVWYCEAWELRRGVSEPCEAGSKHDAPDFDCHWRVLAPIPEEETDG